MAQSESDKLQIRFLTDGEGNIEIHDPVEAARKREERDKKINPKPKRRAFFGTDEIELEEKPRRPSKKPRVPAPWRSKGELTYAIRQNPIPGRYKDIVPITDVGFNDYQVVPIYKNYGTNISQSLSPTRIRRIMYEGAFKDTSTLVAPDTSRHPDEQATEPSAESLADRERSEALIRGLIMDEILYKLYVPGRYGDGRKGKPHFASPYSLLTYLDKNWGSDFLGVFHEELAGMADSLLEDGRKKDAEKYRSAADYYANLDDDGYNAIRESALAFHMMCEDFAREDDERIAIAKSQGQRASARKVLDARKKQVRTVLVTRVDGKDVTIPLFAEIDAVKNTSAGHPFRRPQVTDYKLRFPDSPASRVPIAVQLGIEALCWAAYEQERYTKRGISIGIVVQRAYDISSFTGWTFESKYPNLLIAGLYYTHLAQATAYTHPRGQSQDTFEDFDPSSLNPLQNVHEGAISHARLAFEHYERSGTWTPVTHPRVNRDVVRQTIREYEVWKDRNSREDKNALQLCKKCGKRTEYWLELAGKYVCDCWYSGPKWRGQKAPNT